MAEPNKEKRLASNPESVYMTIPKHQISKNPD